MKHTDLLQAFGGDEEAKQEWIGAREQSWEVTVVRKILTGLKLGPLHQVYDAANRITGDKRLHCGALHEAFPHSTVRFATARIPGHRFGEIDDLDEKAFTKSLLYRAYQEELSIDIENEKTLVLVFPWVRSGSKVFYRGMPDFDEPGAGRFWVMKKSVYVVDSLPRYLRAVMKIMDLETR